MDTQPLKPITWREFPAVLPYIYALSIQDNTARKQYTKTSFGYKEFPIPSDTSIRHPHAS